MLTIETKTFKRLTSQELYDLLQLRSEVFVVEQNCIYQDLDGKDQIALHVIGKEKDKVVAYTRIFKPGDYFKNASIGRVVVSKEKRKHKYGYDIMEASIITIKDYFNTTTIRLSAQVYLKSFYNNLSFKEVGEEYLEDGIPHITMIRKA
jgi:ElaA protein